jgi:hypothetical protein
MDKEESGSLGTVGPFLQEILGTILANNGGWRIFFGFNGCFAENPPSFVRF